MEDIDSLRNPGAYVPPPPKEPKHTARLRDVWLVGLIALIVGGVIGAAASNAEPQDAPAAVASPEVRTVTKTVEVTPSACLDALDSAETIFGYAAQGFGAASRGFKAAARFDIDGILAATDDLNAAGNKVTAETPTWQEARDDCRASA